METTRQEIILLEEALKEAISKGDVHFLKGILHDDLLFLAPNGNVITKQVDLLSHASGQMLVEKITSTIEEINFIDDCAIVIVVYDTTGTMLGDKINGKYRYIRVWKRSNNGIRIIAGSCIKL